MPSWGNEIRQLCVVGLIDEPQGLVAHFQILYSSNLMESLEKIRFVKAVFSLQENILQYSQLVTHKQKLCF